MKESDIKKMRLAEINKKMGICNIYLNNAVNPPSLGVSMYASRLSKAVLEKKINPFNVHKYVNAFDPNAKVDMPMDKYQKRALYNCIIKISEGLDEKTIKMGIHPYDPSYFILKYPFKCNANNAIKDCQKTIQFLSLLKDKFITRNGFMRRVFDSKIEKEEPVDIIEIQDYLGNPGRFEACVANNILFSIFTYMDPSSVKKYLKNDDIDLNGVRNSIMHGRFYYNYETGFDFYDGIIETNTKGKSIKEIEKNIANALKSGNQNELKVWRAIKNEFVKYRTSGSNVDITDDTGREIAQFVGTGYKM